MTQSGGNSGGDSHQWFQPTHWSVVLAAGRREGGEAGFAREQMCQTYWQPIYAFIRRRGYSPEDAQDFTQEFLLHLLEKAALDHVDPAKGKFRSFLLASVKNFLANAHERANALKRGGGKLAMSLDEIEEHVAAGSSAGLSADALFDREWALAIMDRALVRLRERQTHLGRAELFAALKSYLSREPKPGEYAGLQEQLGMNDKAIAMAVHRLRQQYREMVKDEINHTVSSSREAEEELRYFLEVLVA